MGLFDKMTQVEEQEVQLKVYKYYMEIIGGSKELYTVKANRVDVHEGCYIFYMDNAMIASYPISKTIIKSIELKTEE